jgi:hypothetical protein
MADICIIYASEDRERVTYIERALRNFGWDVWWDARLPEGDFRSQIEAELGKAGCVIPVWSEHSVSKSWVLEEARYALDIRRTLLPVKLDDCVVPLGYGGPAVADLSHWPGNPQHPSFRSLEQRIRRVVGSGSRRWDGKRSLAVEVNGKVVTLPAFFRSVSSFETQLRPDAALQVLELLGVDAVLASAYDLVNSTQKSAIASHLRTLHKKNRSVVVIDSGNYEAYRVDDEKWTRKRFLSVLSEGYIDYAFCYDNLKPPNTPRKIVNDVVRRTKRDQRFLKNGQVLPIIHLPVKKSGAFRTEMAPELFARVSQALRTDFIAIPERELGSGITNRVKTVRAIRTGLNELGHYQAIHLLGTGNPLSVAIFAAAGADSFDGLEWCRTVADHESATLFHFQHWELFKEQTASAETQLVKLSADAPGLSYNAKVAFHNLEFFRFWTVDVQRHTAADNLASVLRAFLPRPFFSKLQMILPDLR